MCRTHPARAFCNEFFNPGRTEASPVPGLIACVSPRRRVSYGGDTYCDMILGQLYGLLRERFRSRVRRGDK